MEERIKNIISIHWDQMVDGACFYRRISLVDLDLESENILEPKKIT